MEENKFDEQENKNDEVVYRIPKWLIILTIVFALTTVYFALVANSVIGFDFKVKYGVEKYTSSEDLAYYKERYEDVDELRKYIEDNFYKDISDMDFKEGMIRGLFATLQDPYSTYFNEEEFKSFKEMNNGAYGGLGITISPAKDGYITVIGTFEDTPASRAGIKRGDKIVKVNGVEYPASKMDVAVSKMKGEPGTTVNITIRRDGEDFDLDIERALIVINSVESEIIDKEENIGYIRIRSFDSKVFDEFVENYDYIVDEGAKSFIIDLRGNPGGSLSECVYLADFLLGKQKIVSTKTRNGEEKVFNSDSDKVKLPFIVLIDGGSASASEILAAAIQDSNTAKLVGTKSFGKGIVQTVLPYGNGTGFKITTSEYFTPNGRNIHDKGIEPDVEIELSKDFEYSDRTTDNQLQKAIEILINESK